MANGVKHGGRRPNSWPGMAGFPGCAVPGQYRRNRPSCRKSSPQFDHPLPGLGGGRGEGNKPGGRARRDSCGLAHCHVRSPAAMPGCAGHTTTLLARQPPWESGPQRPAQSKIQIPKLLHCPRRASPWRVGGPVADARGSSGCGSIPRCGRGAQGWHRRRPARARGVRR